MGGHYKRAGSSIAAVSGLTDELDEKMGRTPTVVTVGASGCDYTTIGAALTAITDAASDKRYTVLVYPGTYQEDVTGKAYINIVGADRRASRIVHQTVPSTQTVTLPANSGLYNITVTTAAPSSPGTTCVKITGANVTINGCDLLGGNWNITSNASCDNVVIEGNYCTAANPVYPTPAGGSYSTGWVVTHNSGAFDGTTASCVAFCDAGYLADSTITHNAFDATSSSTSSSFYAIAGGAGGNLIAYNAYTIALATPNVAIVCTSPEQVARVNRIMGNTITMRTTSASPVNLAAVYVNYAGGTAAQADLWLQGNSFKLENDNALSGDVYSIFMNDTKVEDEFDYPAPVGPTIYTDRQSLDFGVESPDREMVHTALVWLDEPFAAEELTDAAGAEGTSITTSLGSTIDLTSEVPVFLRVGGAGDKIAIDPARNLRVVGNADATGTLRIVGEDVYGGRVQEDFVVNSDTPVDGSELFSLVHYCYVTVTGGSGKVATIGVGETVGYTETDGITDTVEFEDNDGAAHEVRIAGGLIVDWTVTPGA